MPCRVQKSTTDAGVGAGARTIYTPIVEYEWSDRGSYTGELFNPCVNGVVEDWDAMHCVWQRAFDNLQVGQNRSCVVLPFVQHIRFQPSFTSHWTLCWYVQVDPADSRILVTDPPLNLPKNREKLLEVMFDEFKFSRLLVQPQSVLALYSQGVVSCFLDLVPPPPQTQCHHALPRGNHQQYHYTSRLAVIRSFYTALKVHRSANDKSRLAPMTISATVARCWVLAHGALSACVHSFLTCCSQNRSQDRTRGGLWSCSDSYRACV